MNITEDYKRLGDMCRDLGYLGAIADEKHFHNSTGTDIADGIVAYITELFNTKRAHTKPYGDNAVDLINRTDAIDALEKIPSVMTMDNDIEHVNVYGEEWVKPKKKMVLEEAIRHCEKTVKECETNRDCADEHRQLAEWLRELKTLREDGGSR